MDVCANVQCQAMFEGDRAAMRDLPSSSSYIPYQGPSCIQLSASHQQSAIIACSSAAVDDASVLAAVCEASVSGTVNDANAPQLQVDRGEFRQS